MLNKTLLTFPSQSISATCTSSVLSSFRPCMKKFLTTYIWDFIRYVGHTRYWLHIQYSLYQHSFCQCFSVITSLTVFVRVMFLASSTCKPFIIKMVTWQPVDEAPAAKAQVTVILPSCSITAVEDCRPFLPAHLVEYKSGTLDMHTAIWNTRLLSCKMFTACS